MKTLKVLQMKDNPAMVMFVSVMGHIVMNKFELENKYKLVYVNSEEELF